MIYTQVKALIDYYVKLGVTGYGIEGMYYANRRHLRKIGKRLDVDSDWRQNMKIIAILAILLTLQGCAAALGAIVGGTAGAIGANMSSNDAKK